MSSNTSLVYSSTTGITSEPPVIVEHVASTTLRMNDEKYGLKTAAKITHEKVVALTEAEKKVEWRKQRDEVLARQKQAEIDKREARLADLTSQIGRIRTSLLTGTASNPDKARTLLVSLEDKAAEITAKNA